MLGGEPLTDDASIRDYNGGVGCQVASALEETLLLPRDMIELRGLRRNEVFLQAKRSLGMVCVANLQSLFFSFHLAQCLFHVTCTYTHCYAHTFFFAFVLLLLLLFFFFKQAIKIIFRMEEIYHFVAQQLDDERKRRVSVVQTLNIAENSNKDLKEKLKAEEQLKKSAEAA